MQRGVEYVDKSLKILSLDGKCLRAASKASSSEIQILELINAITGVLITQHKISDKENEIPVAREVLEQTQLDAETVVTADALHTQDKLANLIVKKTPITSSPSKITNSTSKMPSLAKPRRKVGQLRSILKSLDMDG